MTKNFDLIVIDLALQHLRSPISADQQAGKLPSSIQGPSVVLVPCEDATQRKCLLVLQNLWTGIIV